MHLPFRAALLAKTQPHSLAGGPKTTVLMGAHTRLLRLFLGFVTGVKLFLGGVRVGKCGFCFPSPSLDGKSFHVSLGYELLLHNLTLPYD